MKNYLLLTLALTTMLFSVTVIAEKKPMTEAEKLKWLEKDDTVKKPRSINEGNLTFLSDKKFAKVMHSDNHITIQESSLKNGWVSLKQCYRHLDAFPAVEIVYKYKKMKNLSIVSHQGAGEAKVKKNPGANDSVDLKNVKKGASICVSANIKSLVKQTAGIYTMKNGPFRRQFLDGYFPMRVSISIKFPEKILKPVSVKPEKPELGIKIGKKQVSMDATFEGILNTHIKFRKLK